MSDQRLNSYIMSLPLAPIASSLVPQDADETDDALDISNLPDTFVNGSNMMEFVPGTSSVIKASVALCLLAAQRIAQDDLVVATPEQWIERQNTVLQNLNWQVGEVRTVKQQFKKADEAVRKAIIPFLQHAFAGISGGGNSILAALDAIQDTAENMPWFAIFDRESSRVSVTEYQFSTVAVHGQEIHMTLASARFDASFGRTQVLFFHKTKQSASFDGVLQKLSADVGEISAMREALRIKLGNFSRLFIRDLAIV